MMQKSVINFVKTALAITEMLVTGFGVSHRFFLRSKHLKSFLTSSIFEEKKNINQ